MRELCQGLTRVHPSSTAALRAAHTTLIMAALCGALGARARAAANAMALELAALLAPSWRRVGGDSGGQLSGAYAHALGQMVARASPSGPR